MARIALCMIARDEAERIEACLASVRGSVDEMVVADTGSTDDTVALATAAGARVVHHTWNDDFAAARNAALAACTADWVLVLDADECLAKGAGRAIRAAVNTDALDCGMLPLHNARRVDSDPAEVIAGPERQGEPILLPRLLRRTPDLRWECCVHESIATWLTSGDRRVARVEAPIVHYGNVPELRAALGKDARNLALLERRVATDASDPVAYAYLGIELLRADRVDDARAALARGWEALVAAMEQAMAGRRARPSLVALTFLRTQLLFADGDLDTVAATLDQVDAWGTRHPNLTFQRGRWAEQRGTRLLDQPEGRDLLVLAEAAYSDVLSWAGKVLAEEIQAGITGVNGLVRLGTVCTLLDHHDGALQAFRAALEVEPDLAEAQLGLAEVLLRAGHAEEALQVVEPWLVPEQADGWLIAAAACEQLGALDDMQHMLEVARQPDARLAASHRAWLRAELIATAGIYAGKPSRGPGLLGILAALVAQRPLPVALERAHALDVAVLTRVVVNLLRAGRTETLETLLTRRAEATLPGIRAGIHQILAELGASVEDDGEPDPVFLGGDPEAVRALDRALARHADLASVHLAAIDAICRQRAAWTAEQLGWSDAGVDPDRLDAATSAFLRTLLDGIAGGLRPVITTPAGLAHLRALARVLPRARFVHVSADGDPLGGALRLCTGDLRDRILEVPAGSVADATALRGLIAWLGEPWQPAVATPALGDLTDLRLVAGLS